ncbi:flagellar hook assembly protein FlgD [Alteriqipengyuania lutimaris]|uniref:Basal-body rod modification protein FlgD n=1 Tax=Alteriqipengyuania lutimaris TaxID=1538146 RepID=A0A395LVB9_9SPHN|nr:flagellar hook capping FlgD N-terminal domain-containing protein [Alteriqipengyuania lutimaris]MBB3032472.1 flagellar basal-body rod modification protein FlgD [Alteriqipengyuania lutimaris]RDS78390.1 flagellar hook assembly protein FlgD [Alteriqipengyuania lutimaris]
MTAISSISPFAQSDTAGTKAGAELNANFNMFLKLLTTQMQNQDPLDPMDTSQYTQQLVQYSQVEQSIQQTSTLKDILASLSTQDLAQSANFLGKRVELDSATAGLSDQRPAQWTWQADRPVQTLSATITDGRGRVVETRSLDAQSAGSFAWDGSLAGGGNAAAGGYTLSLKALDAAGQTVPVTIRSTGVIDEVATRDGAVVLGINGQSFPSGALVRVVAGD